MSKIMIAAALVAVAANAKDIRTVTVTTEPQMHCANCEKKIKGFFRFEKGIKKIDTNIPEQRVTLTYDADKTTEQALLDAFSKIDYEVTKISDSSSEKKADSSAEPESDAVSGASPRM